MNRLILISIFLLFIFSCSEKDRKYCYYRGYIHKQFFCTVDKEKAVWLADQYKNLGNSSFVDFSNRCAKNEIGCINKKKECEIIRYYPELGIAKALFRFTNEELGVSPRLDVRKRKYYVPIILLHDTLPKVDTVRYIPEDF
ncbi:hypothetical protein [Marinifilum fragile]|uniref:hypothetical protein n=1 Tax=Marinifilum fragile TaxID=570161 RepID=UPI002AAB4152|nr:hypothetical protein [Marinifilum fragile]